MCLIQEMRGLFNRKHFSCIANDGTISCIVNVHTINHLVAKNICNRSLKNRIIGLYSDCSALQPMRMLSKRKKMNS